ncbi:uncharacterized protein C8A04DRAFT_27820 [Dichotomopilus funicola]|uniref:Uncharacterized protein n=1 Tax=Dichotomopilus funicola TaxID=1934379 RepID=A0AAN6ZPB7_9PEZI|nr:hypothetical protein C8A04DRAFT_27820 [Dichotomopilus funicola]
MSAEARSMGREGGVFIGISATGCWGKTSGVRGRFYPERLLIYHAGTGKTTFLAYLKVTTLFLLGFFDFIVVPAYLQASHPILPTIGVGLCGIIPVIYVTWSTSPFIASMHLHLPPYARWSQSILERFARTAPPNTRLDITTMSLIGKPRVSSVTLADLRPARERLGMVNYVRDATVANANRKWWRFRAVTKFHVHDGMERSVKEGWVWGPLADGIAKRAAARWGDGGGKDDGVVGSGEKK